MPYAVFRQYSSDALTEAITDPDLFNSVVETLRSVDGFRSWSQFSNATGMLTITVCDTQAGCDESVAKASALIAERVPDQAGNPPVVTSAEAIHRVTPTEILP